MPEGPEITKTIEIVRYVLNGYRLIKIVKVDKKYTKIKNDLQTINEALPSEIKFDSKGKLIIFGLEDDEYITISFGLDGNFSFHDTDPYKRVKFVFRHSNGDIQNLYYNDKIQYGNIVYYDDEEIYLKKIKQIGSDLLKSKISDDDIMNNIKHICKTKYKDKLVVELLMDQKKLGSGIGNYLSSEIFYRAKLSPHRKIKTLTNKELKTLAHSIRKTMKLAYYAIDSNYIVNLKKFVNKIKHVNYHKDIDIDDEEFTFMVYRQVKDPYGNTVLADKIIPVSASKKRTTYWVPVIQK